MTNRKEFLSGLAAFAISSAAYCKMNGKASFSARLKKSIEHSLKKHIYDAANETTHRVVEAEISDDMHMNIVSGEVYSLVVRCYDEYFNGKTRMCVTAAFRMSPSPGPTYIINTGIERSKH